MFLLSAFAAFATFLAAVGIYGLMSYGVAQRSHEIGIRMALGAERRDIGKLILGQGMRLTLLGAAIGGVVSIAAMRWIASELYGVARIRPGDARERDSVFDHRRADRVLRARAPRDESGSDERAALRVKGLGSRQTREIAKTEY